MDVSQEKRKDQFDYCAAFGLLPPLQLHDGFPQPQLPAPFGLQHLALQQHEMRSYNKARTKPKRNPFNKPQPALMAIPPNVAGGMMRPAISAGIPNSITHTDHMIIAMAAVNPNAKPNETGHNFIAFPHFPHDIGTSSIRSQYSLPFSSINQMMKLELKSG